MRPDKAATASPSPIAVRIGPVYSIDDLVRWLQHPQLGDAASVRLAAAEKRLVGFLTTDHQWAFPAWSFKSADGHLELQDEVVSLWRLLSHDGFLTDVDLCAWMNTRFEWLDDATPAAYVARHGIDASASRAIRRVRSRVT